MLLFLAVKLAELTGGGPLFLLKSLRSRALSLGFPGSSPADSP